MPDIITNTNAVQITGITDDGTWQTDFDVSAFLNHDDPKIIVVMARNTINAVKNWGVRSTSNVVNTNANVASLAYSTSVVALDSSNRIDYLATVGIELYIIAEFGGDNVKTNLLESQTTRADNAWGDTDLTAIVGGDAGNVEAVICRMLTGESGQVGIRANGATDNFHPARSTKWSWGMAQVDSNDIFEGYVSRSGGKNPANTSWIMIVGWITKDSKYTSVFEPSDQAIATTGAWTAFNSGQDANLTESFAIVRMHNSGANQDGYIREIGSTDIQDTITGTDIVSFIVALDGSEQFQYWIDADTIDIYIEGTFEQVVSAIDVLNISLSCRMEEPTVSQMIKTKE